MFLDGTSFVYKSNPHDQVRAPRSMAWRKRCESLFLHCTSKGEKTGTGGKVVSFMVGISYNSGTVLYEQYHGWLDGAKFAALIREHFPTAFSWCQNKSTCVLQDGFRYSTLLKQSVLSKKLERSYTKSPQCERDWKFVFNGGTSIASRHSTASDHMGILWKVFSTSEGDCYEYIAWLHQPHHRIIEQKNGWRCQQQRPTQQVLNIFLLFIW